MVPSKNMISISIVHWTNSINIKLKTHCLLFYDCCDWSEVDDDEMFTDAADVPVLVVVFIELVMLVLLVVVTGGVLLTGTSLLLVPDVDNWVSFGGMLSSGGLSFKLAMAPGLSRLRYEIHCSWNRNKVSTRTRSRRSSRSAS